MKNGTVYGAYVKFLVGIVSYILFFGGDWEGGGWGGRMGGGCKGRREEGENGELVNG